MNIEVENKPLLTKFLATYISSYRIQLYRFNFFLAVVYLYFFLLNIFVIHDPFYTYFIIPILFFVLTGLGIIYFKFNRIVIVVLRDVSILAITFITTSYLMRFEIGTGFFIFYPFLILPLPYLIDIRNEKKKFLFFLFTITCLLLLSVYLNIFENIEWGKFNISPDKKKIILFGNLVWGVLLSIHYVMMMINTQNHIYYIKRRNEYKKKLINNFITSSKQITKSDLSELKILISEKNLFFLSKFEKIFPEFIDALGQLSQNDKEICALSKLNMNTKEMARFYNCSVKSIENRKYRIKKRLNIEGGIKFEKFISDL